MYHSTHLNTAALSGLNLINRSPLRRGFLLIALACFAFSQTAQAQDGGEGNFNTAEGDFALNTYITNATAAIDDTAIGHAALFRNTTGSNNTANGFEALFSNTTGDDNTANGSGALFANSTGSDNTANGFEALVNNTTGTDNTANGFEALVSNTTGFSNTASGFQALFHNATGGDNTANGLNALFANTTGFNNTANGYQALASNTIGGNNTANGGNALFANTTASNNTAQGFEALVNSTTGHDNTAEGSQALANDTTGSSNIALGSSAGHNVTMGSNNIDIGNTAVAGDTKKIRIGTVGTQTATFIAGIHGVTVASGLDVVVGSNGQLGTITSSARFKEAIKPMDQASEAILALEPVTFRYKHDLDPDGIPQFGLVAEQVEKVNPDLVVRDEEGKVNTVRYEAVNAMLLNEFLKEHRKVVRLEEIVTQQQKQIDALTTTVQRVNEKLELGKIARRVVEND